MQKLRATHRIVTVVIVAVTVYLSTTGTTIQLIDLHSIFTKAPADDPNVEAMREDYFGPGSYAVIGVKDYTAAALPQGADLQAMLAQTMQSARLTVGQIPLRFVELRMAGQEPVGIVESGGRLAEFDAQSGQIISAGPPPRPVRPPVSQFHQSPRNMFKVLHRMTLFGNYALFINVIVGLGLFVMIITGIVMYFKMLGSRRRGGRTGPFWSGGGWWKTWHRRISIVAAAFITVVAFSGLWLAYESLYFGFYMGSATQRANNAAFAARMAAINAAAPVVPRPDPMSAEAQPLRLAGMQHDIGLTDDELSKIKAITGDSVKQMDVLRKSGDPQQIRMKTGALHQGEADRILTVLTPDDRPKFQAWRDAQLIGMPALNGNGNRGGGGGGVDASSPLKDTELPAMLQVTLVGLQRTAPNTPIKAIRLRYYAGMPQGVVITGGEKETTQLVFNAQTGQPVSETEPGYPATGFPFGWQAHQWGKAIHRGSIIGLPGRFMDLFAGLSMLFLSISGIVMYVDYWKKKRQSKRILAQHQMQRVV